MSDYISNDANFVLEIEFTYQETGCSTSERVKTAQEANVLIASYAKNGGHVTSIQKIIIDTDGNEYGQDTLWD